MSGIFQKIKYGKKQVSTRFYARANLQCLNYNWAEVNVFIENVMWSFEADIRKIVSADMSEIKQSILVSLAGQRADRKMSTAAEMSTKALKWVKNSKNWFFFVKTMAF